MSNFIETNFGFTLIHIPKCGGLSIRKNNVFNFIGPYFGYIPEQYSNYQVIGFCRHPIQRFLSAYKMFAFGTPTYKSRKYFDIDEAIKIILDPHIKYKSRRSFKHHVIPITHPYNCIDKANYIIRYENYHTDCFKIFRSMLNIPFTPKHINSSNKKQITLSKKQKDILYDYYHQDFISFNYK